MASNEDTCYLDHGIFIKSKIPVCSIEYKKVLKQVKEKRLDIENKESELVKLKNDLKNMRLQSELRQSTQEPSDEKYECQPVLEVKELCEPANCSLRETIITPGGTKRKGKRIVSMVE